MKTILFIATMLFAGNAQAQKEDIFLFYNSASENLSEIGISSSEVDKAFDDTFGPASDELPDKVRKQDFYVSKFGDGSYVFILNANFNCGQLGCATEVYKRDNDGDLQPSDSTFPVKCKNHGTDKLICIKGGYKIEKKSAPKKRGPVHYPAPVEE